MHRCRNLVKQRLDDGTDGCGAGKRSRYLCGGSGGSDGVEEARGKEAELQGLGFCLLGGRLLKQDTWRLLSLLENRN